MKVKIIASAALILFLLSCSSSSKITNSWRSATATAKNYSKIMVVCLLQSNNREVREKMEEHLVGDLASRGYSAISCLKEYGPAAFENMKEEQAIAKLRTSAVDAVVTIILLDKKKEAYYVPARSNYSPAMIAKRDFWGYYSNTYNRIYTPGYYQVDRQFFWESNFFDMAANQLLYSAQTKSFNPDSKESLAHEYGKMIVADMAKQGIIK